MTITMNPIHGTAVGSAVPARLREAWGPATAAGPGLAARRGSFFDVGVTASYVRVIAPTSKTDRGTALPAAAQSVVTT